MESSSTCSIRQFGQLSLASFLQNNSCSNKNCTDKQIPTNSNNWRQNVKSRTSVNPCLSLSEYFGQKRERKAPKRTQKKQRPFSFVGNLSAIGSDCEDTVTQTEDQMRGNTLNESVFQQFKHIPKEEKLVGTNHDFTIEESSHDSRTDERESRKRRKPWVDCRGEDEKVAPLKHIVVLGDDPKPKLRRTSRVTDRRLEQFYNHYANGRGWWDYDREGVDSEEVGCREVWEGMGSSSIGGLEWH